MIQSSKTKVLVTGAEGALGSAVAHRFAAGGFEVHGTFFKAPLKGQPSQSEDVSHWIQVDLTQSEHVKKVLGEQLAGGSGGFYDVLVHCAGGFRFETVENTTDEMLSFLVNTNLLSAFYVLRELLPGMKKRNFGRVVLISSRATLEPAPGLSAYSASKAGLNLLVASVANEVKDYNININAVLPSVLDTPANRRDMPKAPFSKWVKLEQLAEIIFSLTQPLGEPIHGALIPVSGRV